MKLILAVLLIFAGCATVPERFLTPEQDAEARAACVPDGCVLIPIPTMNEILNELQRMWNSI